MNIWEIFYQQFVTYKGYITVLEGLRATLIIAVCGLLIGFVLGCILAVFKLLPSKRWYAKLLGWIANIYVAIFRGTPMAVQLLIAYFVLFPALHIRVDALVVAVIAFGMNSGAYVCEIMRGGILSVDKGQMEAGRALGMSYGATMLRIVIPQAFKNVVPTLGNELITLLKDTSVASFISVVDLTRAFQNIVGTTYEYLIPYLVLALCYLILVLIVTLIVRLVERRMRASDRR